MDTQRKLAILADAAKYDASCSTSGSARANKGGVGNAAVGGICHSWSADGRCVALLKVLLSNACAYDCAYCVNRRSADRPRAGFEPEELVRLVMDFYRRNYIEGALLSSGVAGCPDATMERLISVAKTLRLRERFNGYLHLKIIPGASDELVAEATRWADRVSVNIELPSAASLAAVAPDKTPASILRPMRILARASGFEPKALPPAAPPRSAIGAGESTAAEHPFAQAQSAGARGLPGGEEAAFIPGVEAPANSNPAPRAEIHGAEGTSLPIPAPRAAQRPLEGPLPHGPGGGLPSVTEARRYRPRDPGSATLPAGQTTQMVIGASPESDRQILTLAENLYLAYDVRRVYYSAFIPSSPDPRVPALSGPPLLREHRLYQADWLFRFYGFRGDELFEGGGPNLDEALDPKCAWAMRNLHRFPVDVNRAEYMELLRVPGIGPKSASRIVRARREAPLAAETLGRLGVVMKRARWFVTCSGVPAFPSVMRGGGRLAPGIDNPAGLRAALGDGAPSALEPMQLEFSF